MMDHIPAREWRRRRASKRIAGCSVIITVILLMVCVDSGSAWFWGGGKVLLADVSSITLKEGRMTTGRRSSPVPQLRCVGGTARCRYRPYWVQCYNRGSNGYDIQWECRAEMDVDYKFGSLTVSCEGYDHPNDPYVLDGSCGLEYTINLTFRGMKRLGSREYYQGHWMFGDILNVICFTIIIIVLVILICKCCASIIDDAPSTPATPRTYPYYSGGYGGDGAYSSGFRDGNLFGYGFNRPHYHYYYDSSPVYYSTPTTWTSSGWGGTTNRSMFGGSSMSSSSGGSGGGTRMTSGFGGTSRR